MGVINGRIYQLTGVEFQFTPTPLIWEIENLTERQSIQRDDLKTKMGEDRERHVREYHDAKRIAAEIEAERREEEERERNESLRDGPPPPELGKS